MGAGCYYTHNTIPNTKAFWVEVESEEEDELFHEDYQDEKDYIKDCLRELGYCDKYSKNLENGLYEVVFESTYYGDSILVMLESKYERRHYADEVGLHNLAVSNHDRSYRKIQKHLLKNGIKLRMAAGGYVSYEITTENV
jgi:hypothetical protein